MKKEIKNKVSRRLKIISGQVRGLEKMVDEDAYCIDIVTQASAIKHAMSSVEDLVLENHLSTCVIEQAKKGQYKKITEEVIAAYKLSKKK
jgi:DNA-binding FrmR family transcriptional regulator